MLKEGQRERIYRSFGCVLGASCGHLGASWGRHGVFWGCPVVFWGVLGDLSMFRSDGKRLSCAGRCIRMLSAKRPPGGVRGGNVAGPASVFSIGGFFQRPFPSFFKYFLGREAAQDEAQDGDGWPNGTCLREARRYVPKGGREKGTCLREARRVHV